MNPNAVSAIIDSLVERTDEWRFAHDDLTSNFIYHKSGFALYSRLDAYKTAKIEVWEPTKAKFIKFSKEEMKLIYSAIESLRKERIDETQKKTKASIIDMLVPIKQAKKSTSWWANLWRG